MSPFNIFIKKQLHLFLQDFLRRLQNVPCVSKEAFLVALVVTSLYSNIPHSDGIKECELKP